MKRTLLVLCALLMNASFLLFAQTNVSNVILADFTGSALDPYSPANKQMGWDASSGMSAMFAVKYLVLETEGGAVGQGTPGAFDNLIVWFQGGGNKCTNIPWSSKELTWWGNSIAYPPGREAGKTVSFAIDLHAVMGDWWADFINCTGWSQIGLVGSNWGQGNLLPAADDPVGGNPIDELGLKKVYLTTDFNKPASAVDYGDVGFIWDGAVTGSIVAPPMPAQFDLLPSFGSSGNTGAYDCSNQTVTFSEAWDSGTGWWFESKDFSSYNEVVIEFLPVTFQVELVIEYNDGTPDNKVLVEPGATRILARLLGGDVKQIYLHSSEPGALTFVSAVAKNAVLVTSVSLDKPTAALNKGAIMQLTATIAPANATYKNVTWSSDNEEVATVSATGIITAVGAGTAIITVTTEEGGLTAQCTVTVTTASVTVPVTGVTLDQTTATLIAGKTLQLTATVAPADATDKKVTWSSDKETVATVSVTGLVTAVSAGTAIITVTTEDGGKTAACTVTVTPASIPVTGVTLDQTTAKLIEGNTLQLTATVAPADATDKAVTWSSDDETVATVSATGLITAVSKGTATITVTTKDGSKTATCTVEVSSKTGISNVLAEISAYAIGDLLYIQSPVAEKVQIYSISGVLLQNFQKAEGKASYPMNRVKGMVLIVKGSSGWTKKVIKN